LLCFTQQANAQNSKAARKAKKKAKREARAAARERALYRDDDYGSDAIVIDTREKRPSRQSDVVEPIHTPIDEALTPDIGSYDGRTQEMERYAMSLEGIPYRMGGTDSKGFDCSGFTQHVFKVVGVNIPRKAQHQYDAMEAVSLKRAERGDLVFFGKSKRNITHVGIVVEADKDKLVMVHSSSSRGIMRNEVLSDTYWGPRLIGVRRPTSSQLSTR